MRCARIVHLLLLAATAALLPAGCGGDDATRAAAAGSPPPAGPPAAKPSSPCSALEFTWTSDTPTPMSSADGREALDAAVARATRDGHRFHTTLEIDAGELGLSGALVGRRTANGDSRARLTWTGIAGLVAQDMDLQVVDDVLRMRPAGSNQRFVDRGSASGIALDVGRELLDHPQLLVARSAARRDDRIDVTLISPARALSDYATRERRGLATELLRDARSLRITSVVRGRRLAGDSFVLRARMPDGTPLERIAPGTPITITGATRYCQLP